MPGARQATRFLPLMTPTYARLVNAQLVYPATSLVVKESELHSSLARPAHTARYEPERDARHLAATLAYGVIKGHPFMDGNKRTSLFLENVFLRASETPGLDSTDPQSSEPSSVRRLTDPIVDVAKGELDVDGLTRRHEMEPAS